MTPHRCNYLVSFVLLSFIWLLSLPGSAFAQNPNQARIDTLNREIQILKKKIEHWKPKFTPGAPEWILVPLAKGYLPVPRDYKSEADVKRDGYQHWVRGKGGYYYIDRDLHGYRQQFYNMYQNRSQAWRDANWRKLVENSDKLKRELWERINKAEAEIRMRERELDILTQRTPPPGQWLSDDEAKAFIKKLKFKYREPWINRWCKPVARSGCAIYPMDVFAGIESKAWWARTKAKQNAVRAIAACIDKYMHPNMDADARKRGIEACWRDNPIP